MTTAEVPQTKTKTPNPWVFFGEVRGGKAFLLNTVASILAGFSDPSFGWNLNSLRIVVTFWIAFMVLNYGGALVKKVFSRRRKRGYLARIVSRPANLLFLLGSILFARITNLEPAMILGVVIAIEAAEADKEQSIKLAARASIVGAIYTIFVGLSSWVLYSALTFLPIDAIGASLSSSDPNLLNLIVNAQTWVGEYLSVLTIASLSALPLLLLPLPFMEGVNIWKRSKVTWAIIYILASTAYGLALLSLPASYSTVSVPFASWVSLYLIYLVIALGIWGYLGFSAKRAKQIA